ncbi:DNA starvation/stationary phase protection protein [bacterium]|nr:DNA starvation/stationary phase protection protein [bacterium]
MIVAESLDRPIDIGIEAEARQQLAEQISRLLADTQRLYQKTHSYHWNVTGPMFATLHAMFEQQYTELWTAQDVIAERIRALGFYAPATSKEFSALTDIPEDTEVPRAEAMLRNLVDGHEATARTARTVLAIAERVHDAPSADLMTERLQVHEKTAWMLRSLLAR